MSRQVDNSEKSAWWWAYFLAFSLMLVAAVFLGSHTPLDVLNTLVSGLGLVGLWGYVRNVAIGWRKFWAGCFLLNLLFFLHFLGGSAWLAWEQSNAFPILLALVVGAFCFPLLLANFLYAFRSDLVWSRQPAEA